MITVIIYISRNITIADEQKYFLEREIEGGGLYLLEYQKIEGVPWSQREIDEVCRAVSDKIACFETWKLLLVDDRRKNVSLDELYSNKYFLWRLIDIFSGNVENEAYYAVLPCACYVLSTVKKDYYQVGIKKKIFLESTHIRWANYSQYPRLFVYNFREKEKGLYEKREITLTLILLYFVLCNVPVDYYYFSSIYKIDAIWDWGEFFRYARQMKKQYEELGDMIQNSLPQMSEVYQMPVYVDSLVESYYAVERETIGKGFNLRKISEKKTEVEIIHQKIVKEAERQFEYIRSSYNWGDINSQEEYDLEKIGEEKVIYEKELNRLYKDGVWDFSQTMQKLKELEDRNQTKSTLLPLVVHILFIIGEFILIDIAIGIPTIMSGRSVLFLLGITGGIALLGILIMAWSLYVPKIKVKDRYLWEEIEKDIERGKHRIEKELICMGKYRNSYQLYYEIQKNAKGRREKSIRLLEERKILETKYEILMRLSRLQQLKDDGEWKYSNIQMKKEELYYPSDWKRREEQKTPWQDKLPFPYPFVKIIISEKLWGNKTKRYELSVVKEDNVWKNWE